MKHHDGKKQQQTKTISTSEMLMKEVLVSTKKERLHASLTPYTPDGSDDRPAAVESVQGRAKMMLRRNRVGISFKFAEHVRQARDKGHARMKKVGAYIHGQVSPAPTYACNASRLQKSRKTTRHGARRENMEPKNGGTTYTYGVPHVREDGTFTTSITRHTKRRKTARRETSHPTQKRELL